MNIRITVVVAGALVTAMLAPASQAQEATERYIPIGESPGVSGQGSLIGVVDELDYESGELQLLVNNEMKTVYVDRSTRYYIDRSASRDSNVLGTLRDCRAGRRVEVAMGKNGTARWIKIQAL